MPEEGFYNTIEFVNVPDWVANKWFAVDDITINASIIYRCITANNDAVFTPAKWQVLGGVGATTKLKLFKTLMTAGVVLYTLPELPDSTQEVFATMNGQMINFTRVGVNFTVTSYAAGDIENDDELKVFYFA